MILSSSHVKVDRPLFLLCHEDTILLMGGRTLADNVATDMTALISCDMKVILKILGFLEFPFRHSFCHYTAQSWNICTWWRKLDYLGKTNALLKVTDTSLTCPGRSSNPAENQILQGKPWAMFLGKQMLRVEECIINKSVLFYSAPAVLNKVRHPGMGRPNACWPRTYNRYNYGIISPWWNGTQATF